MESVRVIAAWLVGACAVGREAHGDAEQHGKH